MKKVILAFAAMFAMTLTYAQTLDELKAEQGVKKDSIAAIQSRVDALQGGNRYLPRLEKGSIWYHRC